MVLIQGKGVSKGVVKGPLYFFKLCFILGKSIFCCFCFFIVFFKLSLNLFKLIFILRAECFKTVYF